MFVLNNLKSCGSAIWIFPKAFWSAKTIEWRSKILSSRPQTGHICQPTCPWPPSSGEGMSCSNLHWFEWFLLHWMHHLKLYKRFLKWKDNRVTFKKFKFQNVNWSYVPTHIMPMTPFTWRRHILPISSSIWMIFLTLNVPNEGLQIVLSSKNNKTMYKNL